MRKPGRPAIEAQLRDKVHAYLEAAVQRPPEERPITLRSVAAAVGHDRRVLKKYELHKEIDLAAQDQKRLHRSAATRSRKTLDARVGTLSAELTARTRQYENVLALLALTEANARRLGIDPAELQRPLAVPDRSVSAVYRAGTRSRWK